MICISTLSCLQHAAELQTYKYWETAQNTSSISALVFKPNEPVFSTGDDSGGIFLYDVESKSRMAGLSGHTKKVNTLSFNFRGDMLVSGGDDGRVIVWNIPGGTKKFVWTVGNTYTVSFSPDSRIIASGGDGGIVRLWDTDSGNIVANLNADAKKVLFLAFNLDGTQLFAVDNTNTLTWWDVASRRVLRQGKASSTGINSIATNVYADLVLLGSESLQFMHGYTITGNDASFSDIIDATSWKTGMVVRQLKGSVNVIRGLALAPDNNIVAAGGGDKNIRLWDMENGLEVFNLVVDSSVRGLAFSTDGRWLAAGMKSGRVSVWQVSGVKIAREIDWDSYGVVTGRTATFQITSTKAPLLDYAQKTYIAIVGIQNAGVDDGVIETVFGTLSSILANNAASNNYVFVERGRDQVKQILNEQALENIGVTDDKSAVKTGRLANVQKGLLLTVTKSEDFVLTIDVRLVDMATGVSEGAREIKCVNCSGRSVSLAVEKLAKTLIPSLGN